MVWTGRLGSWRHRQLPHVAPQCPRAAARLARVAAPPALPPVRVLAALGAHCRIPARVRRPHTCLRAHRGRKHATSTHSGMPWLCFSSLHSRPRPPIPTSQPAARAGSRQQAAAAEAQGARDAEAGGELLRRG